MIYWQYQVFRTNNLRDMEIELNRLGKEGWEAVSMEHSNFDNSYRALVKRAWDDISKQWVNRRI